MGLVTRIIMAILACVWTYFLYLWLPPLILNYVSGDGFPIFGAIDITIGSFENLVAYITSLGWIILGVTFASKVAAKKTFVRPIWSIIRTFLSLCFWGIFLLVEFNTINVFADLANIDPALVGSTLSLDIDITLLFWVMLGGNIFAFIIAILDFFIAFIPEKEEDEE